MESIDQSPPCQSRKIPLWLVLLDNIPTLLLFVLGFLIIYQASPAVAVIYGTYALFSIVWFWARICPYCHHYDTLACPCGYGAVSAKLFKRKENKSFRKVFRRNILIQYPNWFVPLAFAVYILFTHFTRGMLYLSLVFSLVGFILIPVISKFVGCRNCEIKEECPWMTIKKQERE